MYLHYAKAISDAAGRGVNSPSCRWIPCSKWLQGCGEAGEALFRSDSDVHYVRQTPHPKSVRPVIEVFCVDLRRSDVFNVSEAHKQQIFLQFRRIEEHLPRLPDPIDPFCQSVED